MSLLFHPFTPRVHRERPSHGLGLGLFITHHIVRAHGGTIDVESSERAGTTFRVRLPGKPSTDDR
jgi:signal transduction histidine kinase